MDEREAFSDWITAYSPDALYNEDDVEKKFVLPLFQHLGYPENYGRGKYPLPHRSGSVGRKQEIDHAYFSVIEEKQQNVETALIIVEAKHPDVKDLSKAIQQAQSYGHWLKPLLLVITNGLRLTVLKRQRYREDECVFDGNIAELSNPAQALFLYDQLNFKALCQLKENLSNELDHARFIQLDQALCAYPDIQAILATGDFVTRTNRDGLHMTVVRPKVALEGLLPLAFGEGSCTITFSHVLRRGLRIDLSHRDILSAFMLGINTDPSWHTRRFIQRDSEGFFLVKLAQTATILSGEEAHDLCECIDAFAEAYRAIIYETEDLLKTWEHRLVPTFDGLGCYLFSVHTDVWNSMRHFAEEFEWGQGNTPWHIFENYAPALRISHSKQDHAFLYGLDKLPDHFTLVGQVHVIYVMPEFIIREAERLSSQPWPLSIGQHGLWTAEYTQRWVAQKFIPKLRAYLRFRQFGALFRRYKLIREPHLTHDYQPLDAIRNNKDLAIYLQDLHEWLTSYRAEQVAVAPLRDALIACLKLVQHADPGRIDLHSAVSKIGGVEGVSQHEFVLFQYGKNPQRASEVYEQLMIKLGSLIVDFTELDHIHPQAADYLIRSLHALISDAQMVIPQAILNQSIQAIRILWQQSRFEMRHVWPMC